MTQVRAYHDGQILVTLADPRGRELLRRVHPVAKETALEELLERGYKLVKEEPNVRLLRDTSAVHSDEFTVETAEKV